MRKLILTLLLVTSCFLGYQSVNAETKIESYGNETYMIPAEVAKGGSDIQRKTLTPACQVVYDSVVKSLTLFQYNYYGNETFAGFENCFGKVEIS